MGDMDGTSFLPWNMQPFLVGETRVLGENLEYGAMCSLLAGTVPHGASFEMTQFYVFTNGDDALEVLTDTYWRVRRVN